MTSILPTLLTYGGAVCIILAFGWMGMFLARRSGEAAAEKRQAEANQAAAERVAHAVNDAPRDPAALADRLRNGGAM